MKEKNRNLLKDIGNGIGYGFSIAFVGYLEYILYYIHKYGYFYGLEPNKWILRSELCLGAGAIPFLLYKLIKNIKEKA